MDVRLEDGSDHGRFLLSLMPLRKVVKDYFLICESYYKAIRTAPPHQIESSIWRARPCTTKAPSNCRSGWKAEIETDFDTARRLFTLVCVLQMRG